jgi:MarR family transcriptional regulator, organic hydroperoxide resistance regulator
MEDYREKSIKEIVAAIRRIVRSIYLDSKKMVKEHKITGPQSLVLKSVFTSDTSLSSAELSRILKVSSANMTGIIDRLEIKGFIERIKKAGDRRITLIALTEKGKELAGLIPDPIEEKLLLGLADLNATEIFGILAGFQKIVELLDVSQVAPEPLDPDPSSWVSQKSDKE